MHTQCQCSTHPLCSTRHRRRHQRAEPRHFSARAALTPCVRGGIDDSISERNHKHSVLMQHLPTVFEAASMTASASGTAKIQAHAAPTACVRGRIDDSISERNRENSVPMQHSLPVFEAAWTTASTSGTTIIQCRCSTHQLCSRRHRRRHEQAEPRTFSARAALTRCV